MNRDVEVISGLVAQATELLEILRGMGIRDHTGQWLQFLHWGQTTGSQQRRARHLMDCIVETLRARNGQISARLIHSRVVYDLLQNAVWYPNDFQEFPRQAQREFGALLDYSALRNVDVPLAYLTAGKESATFGLMAVCDLTDEDRRSEWWKRVIGCGGTSESIRAFARIACDGDLENALHDSRVVTSDMLLFLRALAIPMTQAPQHQFGLLNEFPQLLLLPSRLDEPVETAKLEYHVLLSTSTGPGVFSYEMGRDLLTNIEPRKLERVERLISEEYSQPSSDLKRKYLLGLRWLGEASKPDLAQSRFIHLFLALEAFVGGAISDSRQTKRVLAQRCAAVAGTSEKEMERIQQTVLGHYRRRSRIIHGAQVEITEDEFVSMATLVRRVLWGLLEILDRFSTIEELHVWTRERLGNADGTWGVASFRRWCRRVNSFLHWNTLA